MKHCRFLFLIFLTFILPGELKAQKQSSWQQRVNYDIRASLDTSEHGVDAFISMEYFNNSPDKLNQIYIHVWPNAYKDNTTKFARQLAVNSEFDFLFAEQKYRGCIEGLSFRVDGQIVKWDFLVDQIDVVLLQLNKPLEPGQKIIISTPFYVKLPKVFSRSGYENGFYAITQWYPKPAVYDVNGWNYMSYLNQGEFYSEFGDFKVDIKVPEKFVVAATGNMIKRMDSAGFSQYTFQENSIHDFAWFSSDSLLSMAEPFVLPDGDTVQLEAYYRGSISNEAFKAMGATLEQYGKYVGKYPYKTCKLVIGPLEAGAGMEYPTITLCANDQVETVVHEVGHNWFYGMLGTNERRYPWMDESVNSYFDKVVTNSINEFEAKDILRDPDFYSPYSGKAWLGSHFLLVGIKQMIAMGTSQAINLHSAEYSTSAYGLVIYGRGPLAFAYLREQLGDSLFFKCFNAYFNTWKFRHPLPGDMQESFEKTCGYSLNWFFHDMLSEVNSIDYKSTNGGKDYKIKGSDSLDMFLRSRGVSNSNVNANGFMIERNMYNNGQRKKLVRFSIPVGIPTFDKQVQVNIMPFAGYNLYDGLYPLLCINNTLLNDRAIDYAFVPGYSFKRNAVNGYGRISYKYLIRGKRSYIEGGLQGQTYGLNFISLNNKEYFNSYYRFNPYIKYQSIRGKPGISMTRKELKLQFIHTGLSESNYIYGMDTTGKAILTNYSTDKFYNYIKANYKIDTRVLLDRIKVNFDVEYGYNNKFQPANRAYLKTGMDLKYYHFYKKNKKILSELFAGYFPYKSKSYSNSVSVQDLYISGNSGFYDYTYSNVLLVRNEDYFSSNVFGRQLLDNGTMRNIVILGYSSKYWMLVWKNTIDFPGKIPLAFYLDMGYYKFDYIVNGKSSIDSKFLYTGGVEIKVLADVFKIYVPVVYSKEFKSYNNLNQSFINTIGFKLNLDIFEPNKLINGALLDNKVSFSE